MNKYIKLTSIALVGCSLAFVSCSDDNDEPDLGTNGEPTTENVFTAGVPASVGGATITTNEKGQVTKITDGYDVITFEYGVFNPSRASSYTVCMNVDGDKIYMQLNKMGFVEHALQVYEDYEDGTDTWDFEYNNDGQLARLQRSENGDDFKITYTNGDITKVNQIDEDNYSSEYTIVYTNNKYTSTVANKGCIMQFDDFFGIDMDEMGFAYYAGLLGKATKNLPIGYTEKDDEGTWSYSFNWEFNGNGFPTKFWEGENAWDILTFSWE